MTPIFLLSAPFLNCDYFKSFNLQYDVGCIFISVVKCVVVGDILCMWKQRITLTLEVRFRVILTIGGIDDNDIWQLGSVKRHMNRR